MPKAVKERPASYRERVRTIFRATAWLYYDLWGPFFHLAVFDGDGPRDFAAAFEATHRRYLEAIQAERARRIIDLGCGGGAFAEWLAGHTSADVLGIDISETQLARAQARVRPNLRFREHDIMDVDKLDEAPFDAAVCLDAAVYLPDKRVAVHGIARVLTPGARFLLVDWCRPERLTSLQEELLLEPFQRYWGLPSMETVSGYESHFTAAGLRLIEREDLSQRVRPNWERGYEAANRALASLSFDDPVASGATRGTETLRLAKEQYYAALFARAAADAGLLRYVSFLSERAGSG